MKQLEIQFYGPYRWYWTNDDSVLTTPMSNKKGVYLWAIPFEKKYLTYYVGETGRSFSARFLEHARDYLCGLYRVYDPDYFAEGKKILVWGGMWKPDRKEPSTMLEFLNRYSELSSIIYKFLKHIRFFLAPIDSEKRVRQRIEAAISERLSKQLGLIGEFQDSDIKYSPRRTEEKSILVSIEASEQILGLDNELLV